MATFTQLGVSFWWDEIQSSSFLTDRCGWGGSRGPQTEHQDEGRRLDMKN